MTKTTTKMFDKIHEMVMDEAEELANEIEAVVAEFGIENFDSIEDVNEVIEITRLYDDKAAVMPIWDEIERAGLDEKNFEEMAERIEGICNNFIDEAPEWGKEIVWKVMSEVFYGEF